VPTALDAYAFAERAGTRVLEFPLLRGCGATAIVTTRAAGNLASHVADDPERVGVRRAMAATALGLPAEQLVFADQVHGATVTRVGAADAGSTIPATDALVTTEPGIGLVTLVADCVPIVLFDPVARVLATVHAGWRGTVARIAEATLATMVAAGARPDRILAGIGPALPFERNQVGSEVADAARTAFGPSADALLVPDDEPGKWRFDLWGANAWLLQHCGVPGGQVAIARVPTGPGGEFFSHRAEQPCGRFALLAAIAA
jgi:YfiH family protein